MRLIRKPLAALLFYLSLVAPVTAGALTPDCFIRGRSLLAELVRPPATWQEGELDRLFLLLSYSDRTFRKKITEMPVVDRFRLAATFLLASNRDGNFESLVANRRWSKEAFVEVEFEESSVRAAAEKKGAWLFKHFLHDLNDAERIEILKSPLTFKEPFVDDENPGQHESREKAMWRYNMSLLLDRVFGLDIDAAEKAVPEEWSNGKGGLASAAGAAEWSLRRLNPNSQNTTYADMDRFFNEAGLRSGETVVDLGASYGRIGLYLGTKRPGVKFIGYEINPVRVAAGKQLYENLGLTDSSLVEQDLSSPTFVLPKADVYYMYDPVNEATRKILFQKLAERATEAKKANKKIKVICREGRGDFLQFMRKHKWLEPRTKVPSISSPHSWRGDDSIIFESK